MRARLSSSTLCRLHLSRYSNGKTQDEARELECKAKQFEYLRLRAPLVRRLWLTGTLVPNSSLTLEHSFVPFLDTLVGSCGAPLLDKQAFRSRLPPNTTRPVSNMSRRMAREVFQTIDFVRDFPEKSHVKSPKRASWPQFKLTPIRVAQR